LHSAGDGVGRLRLVAVKVHILRPLLTAWRVSELGSVLNLR
jgi:hypothetical protein